MLNLLGATAIVTGIASCYSTNKHKERAKKEAIEIWTCLMEKLDSISSDKDKLHYKYIFLYSTEKSARMRLKLMENPSVCKHLFKERGWKYDV